MVWAIFAFELRLRHIQIVLLIPIIVSMFDVWTTFMLQPNVEHECVRTHSSFLLLILKPSDSRRWFLKLQQSFFVIMCCKHEIIIFSCAFFSFIVNLLLEHINMHLMKRIVFVWKATVYGFEVSSEVEDGFNKIHIKRRETILTEEFEGTAWKDQDRMKAGWHI